MSLPTKLGDMTTAFRKQIASRPTTAFFVLAFAISWAFMTPAMIAGTLEGAVALPFFVGVFGPATAGAIVTRATGGSIRQWLRDTLRLRVPIRWYALAIGFPVALAVVASVEFALVGEELDFGLVGERAVSFLPLFIFCLLLNGGPEEPGWRGYALPKLQEQFTPVRATFLLGGLWGLWHLPLLLVEDNAGHDLATLPLIAILIWTLAGFSAYAFTYTYLYNRTRSVLLCMLLHAAYNTAIGVVILRPADELVGDTYVAITLALTGTLWLVAVALIVATRGGLGLDEAGARTPKAPPLHGRIRRPAAGAGRHSLPFARG
jgi:membrane protease YdiL (CAAX protease family)